MDLRLRVTCRASGDTLRHRNGHKSQSFARGGTARAEVRQQSASGGLAGDDDVTHEVLGFVGVRQATAAHVEDSDGRPLVGDGGGGAKHIVIDDALEVPGGDMCEEWGRGLLCAWKTGGWDDEKNSGVVCRVYGRLGDGMMKNSGVLSLCMEDWGAMNYR